MHVEVSVALNFVISYLYNKLPRRRVDNFGEELERGLKNKFNGHWYPDQPFKGSGYRCIRVSGEKVDPVITKAAIDSGLDIDEIKDYLPKDLTVWIDPNEVSYQIGEKGVVKILYSDRQREDSCLQESLDREVQAANKTFNPDAQSFKPIDSLSSSLSNLSLSPSSPTPGSNWNNAASPTPGLSNSSSPINSYLLRNNVAPIFTTAMFAQTKFGSTKLKTHPKRPARLSPTELTAFIKQRTCMPGLVPGATSPHAAQQPSPLASPMGAPPPFPVCNQQPHSRTISPREVLRDPRQAERMQQQLMAQQQLAATFRNSALSQSLGDLYLQQQSNIASPEGEKSFLEGLNSTLPAQYSNLQHLLVAN
eukprot:GHVU01065046.1.p1 GENE.GHVU01065046.1~~GHVU01065046.1.p1  ORF type:complete len:364 (-),score=37.21 GHVU01065046.1:1623-2714(-)